MLTYKSYNRSVMRTLKSEPDLNPIDGPEFFCPKCGCEVLMNRFNKLECIECDDSFDMPKVKNTNPRSFK